MQPALQDEPRPSRGVLGQTLADNGPNTGPNISGQTAFRYPVNTFYLGTLTLSLIYPGSVHTGWRSPRSRYTSNRGILPKTGLFVAQPIHVWCTYLDSEQETKIYLFYLFLFWGRFLKLHLYFRRAFSLGGDTRCYAIVPPGRKSGLRAIFRSGKLKSETL